MKRYLVYALVIGTFCYVTADYTSKLMMTKIVHINDITQ
jgi:hypothetical protein